MYAANYLGPDGLQGTDYFAVNLFDPGESNIRPAPFITLGRAPLAAARRDEAGQRELWPWLAGAGLAILLLEWWVYHRGMTLPAASGRRWALLRRRWRG
ncbi:MAG: hypothetical protein HY784_12105 [Chloroflexi bacterium]|nr:hypothetical protein [Chloroflexota bacterium]